MYTKSFKTDLVRGFLYNRVTLAEVQNRYGIHEMMFKRWIVKYKKRGEFTNDSKGTEKTKKIMRLAYEELMKESGNLEHNIKIKQ